jgi:hypothetical protein
MWITRHILPCLTPSQRRSPRRISAASHRVNFVGFAPTLMTMMASRHRCQHHADSRRDDGIAPSPRNGITPSPLTHGSVAPPPSSRGGITPRLLLAASHRAGLLVASHRQRPSPRAVVLHLAWSSPPPPLSASAALHRCRCGPSGSSRSDTN